MQNSIQNWTEADEVLRRGVGVVSAGGGPNSLSGPICGMGVCGVRTSCAHFAMASILDVDRQGVFGVATPPCAAALHCPGFLMRFQAFRVAVGGGTCVQGSMFTSSSTSDDCSWNNRGTTTSAAPPAHVAKTTHTYVCAPHPLGSVLRSATYI